MRRVGSRKIKYIFALSWWNASSMVEQWPLKPLVLGSSPRRSTNSEQCKIMWYVYALKGDNRIYIGMTSDLRRRFSEHKQGKTHSTSRMGELILVYYEAFLSKLDASKQEKFYKTGRGREILKEKLSNSLIIGHGPIV
jgi:putative endonuclease